MEMNLTSMDIIMLTMENNNINPQEFRIGDYRIVGIYNMQYLNYSEKVFTDFYFSNIEKQCYIREYVRIEDIEHNSLIFAQYVGKTFYCHYSYWKDDKYRFQGEDNYVSKYISLKLNDKNVLNILKGITDGNSRSDDYLEFRTHIDYEKISSVYKITSYIGIADHYYKYYESFSENEDCVYVYSEDSDEFLEENVGPLQFKREIDMREDDWRRNTPDVHIVTFDIIDKIKVDVINLTSSNAQKQSTYFLDIKHPDPNILEFMLKYGILRTKR